MELREVKKLGFGLMRLPRKGEEIDIELTKQMVDRFMEAGFSYFDTAWAYPGSEEAIGEALVKRYPRESFVLTTKNACWKDGTREAAERQLFTSLERTGAGYFDLYLLHNMGSGREKVFERCGVWDFVNRQKEAGLIRHIGFSAHTTPELIDELLTAHPETEFVQLQINYADWESPSVQSRACYETVLRHGKQVIIMEPVKGGLLASPPDGVKEILSQAVPERSPASWALRFAAALPGVLTVLSGMSDPAQMRENLETFRSFAGLSPAEEEALLAARKAYEALPLVPCTGCDYCAPGCPEKVGISGVMKALNIRRAFQDEKTAADSTGFSILAQGRTYPDHCVDCGACETVCPQNLPIRELLKEFRRTIPAG